MTRNSLGAFAMPANRRRRLALVSALGTLFALLVLVPAGAAPEQESPVVRQPHVVDVAVPTSVDVSAARLIRLSEDAPTRPQEVPLGETGSAPAGESSAASEEAAAEAQGAEAAGPTPPEFSTPFPTFPGISSTNRIPPDTVGAIGPDHYVQMVNSNFQVFDRTGAPFFVDGGGNPAPPAINSLWVAADTNDQCEANNNGDPIVLYDEAADRWVLSQFAVPSGITTPPTFECVAVSQTPDPTAGTWHLYQFTFTHGFDYPKLSVWPDAYYMSSQRGFPGGNIDVYAMDRANMLNGNPATIQEATIAPPALMVLPSDLDGVAPDPGTPAFFARMIDGNQWGGLDRIEVYEYAVDWGMPALSTFTLEDTILTPVDSTLCDPGSLGETCVSQPGTTQLLDTLANWPMFRLQFRHFGDYQTMVFNHTGDADGAGHAGVAWFELRRDVTTDPPGGWVLHQGDTFAPDDGAAGLADDPHRWMGSIAMDKAGNIAVGYSASVDATNAADDVFPSIYYAGREAGDPPDLLPHGEVHLQDGNGSQGPITCTGGPCGNRWGDYSAMTIDPLDDCTFWFTSEFIPANNAGSINWQTRIGAFRFPSCNPADLEIVKADHPDPVNAGEPLFYDITVINNGTDDATNVLVVDELPDEVDYITDTDTCAHAVGPPETLTCQLGDLQPGHSKTFTIQVKVHDDVVSDNNGPKTIVNRATVTSDQLDPDTTDNEVTAETIVTDSADLEIVKICEADTSPMAGDNVDCTLIIDNHGPSFARDVVVNDRIQSNQAFTVTDVTPSQGTCSSAPGIPPPAFSHEIECALGDLETATGNMSSNDGRATVTYTITGQEGQELSNVATVDSPTPDPDEENNRAEKSIKITSAADLAVSKSDSPSDTVVAGEQLTYTIVATNEGPSAAQNVQIVDRVPAGVTIDSVEGTVSPSGGATCNAGEPGNEFKPTTCAFGALSTTEIATMTIEVTVLPDTRGQLNNDAEVTSDTEDINNSNNFDTESTIVAVEADLKVTKADSPDPVKAGTPLDYTITVLNEAGPSSAHDVTLTDDLPDEVDYVSTTVSNGTGTCDLLEGEEIPNSDPNTVLCELQDLDPTEHVTLILHTFVKSGTLDSTIENEARVKSDATDNDSTDDIVIEPTDVITEADLSVFKTSDKDVYQPSSTVIYTITVTNLGPSDAQSVTVVDTLPPKKIGHYSFDTAHCQVNGNILTCDLGTIVAHKAKSFNVYFRVVGNKGEIVNKAVATTTTFDPNKDPVSGNNHSVRRAMIKGNN